MPLEPLLFDRLAKSRPPETIRAHTDALLAMLEQLLAVYPESLGEEERALVREAARWHDVGKLSYAFQKKIAKSSGLPFLADPAEEALYREVAEVPHGYLSPGLMPLAALEQTYGRPDLRILINAVYYHHAREEREPAEIRRVLEEDLARLPGGVPVSAQYLTRIFRRENKRPSEEVYLRYVLVKGTLNRLDYAASARERPPIELPREQDGRSLAEVIESRMQAAGYALRPVQRDMQAHGGENLVVTASTGMGKTEAACLWSGNRKLFYTLPLQVSINAIYERLHGGGAGQYGFQNCILLHADALNVLGNEEAEGTLQRYRAARLFSYPATVCTVDQLFTFVYKYNGSELVPAVLQYAGVVIDEIQSYAPELAAKLIYGLKQITQMGGRFVIMTATLPPVLAEFMARKALPFRRLGPYFTPYTRHVPVYRQGEPEPAELLRYAADRKVLCICNTVRKANQLYQTLLEHGADAHLLHARFKRRHRDALEAAILRFSHRDAPGIWVTTQIVEASLDIDFDLLCTEMCPADSLLQRMGRCWRSRPYPGDAPNVLIYDTGNGVGTVYADREIYARSAAFLQEFSGKPFPEEAKHRYVEAVYDAEALRGSAYYRQLADAYGTLESLPLYGVTRAEAIERFRDIAAIRVLDDAAYIRLLETGALGRIDRALGSGDAMERMRAEETLLQETVSLRRPRRRANSLIDAAPIDLCQKHPALLPVHRTRAAYEFDEDALQGRGLLETPQEEEAFL